MSHIHLNIVFRMSRIALCRRSLFSPVEREGRARAPWAVGLGLLTCTGRQLEGLLRPRVLSHSRRKVTDKPYAAFVTHGGGGAAIGSIESIARSFKLKKAADPVLVKGKPDAPALAALKTLGRGLAAGVGKP